MKKSVYTLAIIIFLFGSTLVQASSPVKTLTLGIFAYLPKTMMEEKYQPLIDYLNSNLQQYQIKMLVLDIEEIETALKNKQLDFIITNPNHYNILRHHNKFSGAIATIIKLRADGISTQNLAGVIFTRNSANNISQISDIKGQKIAIPGTKYLGGYQTQAYELFQAGIKLPEDARIIKMGSHHNVVSSVLSGKADVGFVRSEILETMSNNGKINMADIKIINRQNMPHFPFISSTQLYPEWPFVALPHVELEIISRISSVLLAINEQQTAIRQSGIAGFAPPADYLIIENTAQALRLPPHDKAAEFSLLDIWQQHRTEVIFLALFFIIISTLLAVLFHRNKIVIKQQQLLKKQNNHIEQIIYATQAGTWEWNIKTDEAIFNKRWAEILGYTLAELSPVSIHTWTDFTHKDDLKAAEQHLQDHFEGKTDYYQADFRMKHKAGHWIWINARGLVTKWSKEGRPLLMSGTHTDISERKIIEQHYIESRNEAIKANKAKSEFLSRMSHELRTPMNAILGFAQLMELDAVDSNKNQLDNIQEILNAGNHLLILINEILDLSKIESGKFEVIIKPVPITEIIQQCIALMSSQITRKRIKLEDNLSNQKYCVHTDPVRFKQVILNILSNAVKYNHYDGSVILDAKIIKQTSGESHLRISVADSGIGISKDNIAQLYQPFERFDKENTVEGTGIGLSITKSLIDRMGGSIGVSSTPGKGSVFWIELELCA